MKKINKNNYIKKIRNVYCNIKKKDSKINTNTN